MATEMVNATAGAEALHSDGLYLVGEFLGYRDRAPREVNGREVVNCDVGIRIDGGAIETVQYGSRSFAEDAMGPAEIGERVAVQVENRHGIKNGRAWQFYTGARGGASSSFADQFGG